MPVAQKIRLGGGSSLRTPADLSGVVARFKASDHAALADATAIASWTDLSDQGNTLTQATGANQPTKQTVNGLPCVRFVRASSHHMKKASPSGIPLTGDFTVIAIASFPDLSTYKVLIENAGAGSKGWAVGLNGAGHMITNYSVDGNADSGPTSTTAPQFHFWSQSGGVNRTMLNLRRGAVRGAVTITGPATQLCMGRADFFPTWPLSADVYEVVIYNRLLTEAEIDSLRPYVVTTYGIQPLGTRFTQANYQATTPTADASSSCIEADVLDFGSNWNGYRYWMGMVPYAADNRVNENPHIFASADGATWVVPAGVTNPIAPYPGGGTSGYQADPHLFYNTANSTLYCFYIRESSTSADGVYERHSTDGVTWSAETRVIAATGSSILEPTVLWDGTQYVMYGVTDTTTDFMWRRTSASLTSGWSAATPCVLPIPNSRTPWHIDVELVGGRYVAAFSDGDAGKRDIWLASSLDGINWTVAANPVLVPSWNGWDGGSTYRPSLQPPVSGSTDWRLWYTGGTGIAGQWHLGYVTIPATEIPS